uniref:Uncharacterized protein n=1 Tax=Coccidioides posadasii RMSCC 3488 TaxID=454284 RepID=A0A0J6I394_COCPO|nr:hypothetical protein CPAG_02185 [Coccidioides posadasii RMSCC 3488]
MHLLNSGRRTPKVHKRNADSKFGVWHFKAVTPCLLAQVCHRHRIGYFYVWELFPVRPKERLLRATWIRSLRGLDRCESLQCSSLGGCIWRHRIHRRKIRFLAEEEASESKKMSR